MDTEDGPSAFDALVDGWMDAELVRASDWGEPWLVVMDHAGRNEVTAAVCRSFPHAGPVGTVEVVVCPEFVAELCAWYAGGSGPSVAGRAVGELAAVGRMDDDALAGAVAKVSQALGPVSVTSVLSVVAEAGAVADAHGLALGDVVELVRVGDQGPELAEMDVVLSVVLDDGGGR